MRSDNLKKHEMICRKKEDVSSVLSTNNKNTIGDILNKVRERAQDRTAHFSALPQSKTEALEIKPKLDLSKPSSETESDSEFEDEDESSDTTSESELEKLKEKFRNLFNQLHLSIGVINEIALVLDELEKYDFLTNEESDALKENIQKRIKLDIDDIHTR